LRRTLVHPETLLNRRIFNSQIEIPKNAGKNITRLRFYLSHPME